MRRLWVSIFILFMLNSCSVQKMAVNATASLIDYNILSFYEEEDPEIAKIAGASNLKLLEGLIKADPGNDSLLIKASQAFGGYAFLFVEDESSERAEGLYRRGMEYGLKVLEKKEGFQKALKGDIGEFEKALKSLQKEDMPALFWTTYCWAGKINLNRDSPRALIEIPRVKLMMDRALELDETFFYGSPHLLLATYYASRPKMLGGQPEKAREHFEKAIQLNQGKFLLSYFLYAKFYAVQIQDKELYRKLLDRIVAAKPDILPEQMLSNQIAKIKAERALKNIDEIF
jgi:tetratricopeptide (TPR) repeat protein